MEVLGNTGLINPTSLRCGTESHLGVSTAGQTAGPPCPVRVGTAAALSTCMALLRPHTPGLLPANPALGRIPKGAECQKPGFSSGSLIFTAIGSLCASAASSPDGRAGRVGGSQHWSRGQAMCLLPCTRGTKGLRGDSRAANRTQEPSALTSPQKPVSIRPKCVASFFLCSRVAPRVQ